MLKHNIIDNSIKNQRKKNIIYLILILLITSIGFLMLFSFGTSCLYNHKYIGKDSDIFLALGKFTKNGLVPYKDFFDHKGPYIIFVEWLGYIIGNGKLGVFVIQVISLLLTLLGGFKILRLYYSKKISLLFTISSLIILNIYYDRGNLTEEFILPFLMWSTYFAIKYLKNEEKEHLCRYCFLYGVTFIIGAMTRLTNSIPLVVILCVLLTVMIKKQLWINALKNIGSFLLGEMIVLLPILFYFIKVDALDEMIYATFIYNFKHGFERNSLNTYEIINMIALSIPFFITLLIGIQNVIFCKKKNISRICGIIVSVSCIMAILLLIISRPYPHYYMIWFPICVVGMGLISNLIYKNKLLCVSLISLCLLVAFGKLGTSFIEIYDTFKLEYAKKYEQEIEKIICNISSKDNDKVIAINTYPYFYLITDINPCYKNFTNQNLHTLTDKKVKNDFLQDLNSQEAKYIVTGLNEGMFKTFINYYYRLIYKTESLRLYERK